MIYTVENRKFLLLNLIVLSVNFSKAFSPSPSFLLTNNKCKRQEVNINYDGYNDRIGIKNRKSASSTLKASDRPLNLYGGDYAGLSANFSPDDGTLIRVPDHLVPKDLLEWEGSPSCLEVLVSEEGVDEDDEKKETSTWLRQTISVLPSVGCGVDNLETTKKEEQMDVQSLRIADDLISFDIECNNENENNKKKRRRTETIFGLSSSSSGDDTIYRLRVKLDFSWNAEDGFVYEEPINLTLERKVNETSSGGRIADGGGLTGSYVSELLGSNLKVSNSFCEESPLSWGKEPQGIKMLNLPGNVTIACSDDPKQSPWMLDILHLNINDKGEAEQQIIRRSYFAKDI